MPRLIPHSEETKLKISAGNRGKKRTPEMVEVMRLRMIGVVPANKGIPLSEEQKQNLREARARQIHPRLVARGITREMLDDAEANGLRWCSGACKAFVPKISFASPIGPTGKCKPCTAASIARRRSRKSPEELSQDNAAVKQWRDQSPEKVRRQRLMATYGVTPEWYDRQLELQGGTCALCPATKCERKAKKGSPMVNFSPYLFVDHNHETGAVRGLLCGKCNTALHRVEYIQDWAVKAVAYLASPKVDPIK
jgi:hypothetical protein